MSTMVRTPTVVTMPSTRPIRTLLVAGGLGVAALLTATACGLVWNTLSDGLAQDTPVNEVRISGGSGDVVVIGDDTTGVDVRRTVRYVGETKPGPTMSVSGSVLSVNTSCGMRCSASYEVHVPRGVTVTGRNDSGQVTARGVSEVDVEVDSGNIEVDGATGSVKAKADSGRIRVTDVAGSATLTADSGNVEVDRVAGKLNVAVESGNIEVAGINGQPVMLQANSGNITAALRTAGDLTARADSGQITIEAPDDCCRITTSVDSGNTDRRLRDNPSSSALIDVRTGSGNITLRAA
jgi:putative adhesin